MMDEKNEIRKIDRRVYMRNYMRQRNIKIRGDPRPILTDEQKKQKIKDRNKNYYINNRDKSLEYARQKRETRTGFTKMDKIKKLYNMLTPEEKEIVKTL
jgi:hypothetical protein